MKNSYYKLTTGFIFLFLLISTAETNAQQNVWTQKQNVNGVERWGAFGFSIGNYGYIGGGYDGSNNLDDFWQYDPSNNTWIQKANVPVALRGASTFVINGKGYLTGGIITGPPYNANLYMYDPATDGWINKAPYPGFPVYGAQAFAIGTKGYFGVGNGGTSTGDFFREFYEYNSNTDAWTQRDSFPGTERFGTFGIALNGKGYVGFGANGATLEFFNDWWEYNPANDAWTAKTNFPGTTRDYVAGFTLYNQVFLGTGHENTGTFETNDFYSYDPSTDSWIIRANYGGGNRWLVVGFSIGNKGYFGTGMNNTTSTNYNDFWEYAPTIPEGIAENDSYENGINIYPNPCTTCEITGVSNASDLSVTDILGRKQNATFSKSAYGYYINLPVTSSGIFLIKNNKTGEVVKLVKN
ncbi:MAG: kelch repeat-containing protein [Bacteroidota bacterium]